jgi:hypothetical protein
LGERVGRGCRVLRRSSLDAACRARRLGQGPQAIPMHGLGPAIFVCGAAAGTRPDAFADNQEGPRQGLCQAARRILLGQDARADKPLILLAAVSRPTMDCFRDPPILTAVGVRCCIIWFMVGANPLRGLYLFEGMPAEGQ